MTEQHSAVKMEAQLEHWMDQMRAKPLVDDLAWLRVCQKEQRMVQSLGLPMSTAPQMANTMEVNLVETREGCWASTKSILCCEFPWFLVTDQFWQVCREACEAVEALSSLHRSVPSMLPSQSLMQPSSMPTVSSEPSSSPTKTVQVRPQDRLLALSIHHRYMAISTVQTKWAVVCCYKALLW